MIKLLPKASSNKKGFTLIELLVVVAIIAILAIIGIIVYGNFQVRARDARRISDLDAIATALEVAKSNAGTETYPALAASLFASGAVPVDPTRVYCSASGTDAAITALAPPAAWTVTSCAGVTNYTNPVVVGQPAAGAAWRVCASTELQGVQCKRSQQ